jgi:hypothetical protein
MRSSPQRQQEEVDEPQTEKKEFSKKNEEFAQKIDDILKISSWLFKMSKLLMEGGKNSLVLIHDPSGKATQQWPFSRSDLRSSIGILHNKIKALRQTFRESKHRRRVMSPIDRRGVFTPIYLGDALKYFFTGDAEGFGTVNPNDENDNTLLMDQLPEVKNGYMLRNAVILLAYDYFRVNNLQNPNNGQYVSSNDHMMKAFNQIPADFFVYDDNGKKVKIPMAQAVQDKLFDRELSVYEALQYYVDSKPSGGKAVGFSPDNFKTYYMQSISSYSFFTFEEVRKNVRTAQENYNFEATQANADALAAWTEIQNNLADDEFTLKLVDEHDIIQQTTANWTAYYERIGKKKRGRKGKKTQ